MSINSTVATVTVLQEEALAALEASFASLGLLALRLCCIVPPNWPVSQRLRDMNWMCFATSVTDEVLACTGALAILVCSDGTDMEHPRKVIRELSRAQDWALIISVIAVHADPDGDSDEAAKGLELASRYEGARFALLQAGVDDAMVLYGGEPLTPCRVMEAVARAEVLARKMAALVSEQVAAVKAKSDQKLKESYRRFLLHLSNSVLDAMPVQDNSLREEFDERGNCQRVGPYEVKAKLGSGAIGQVCRATHPQQQDRAIKVVRKSNLKNARMLISLDRELQLVKYLKPHPNIVRAYEVLHGIRSFVIAMSYEGPYNLHKYTKVVLERTGGKTLPREQVISFCRQQASALDHLHSLLVCHLDVKPENMIVNEEGTRVCLTDFGLAVQLVDPSQPVTCRRGSLPFCAPEVFEVGMEGSTSEGFNGLMADCWSFGVNVMEAVLGPFSIERCLGWKPRRANEEFVVLQDLQRLEEVWASIRPEEAFGLHHVVSQLVVLPSERRWTMAQVLGAQGLGAWL